MSEVDPFNVASTIQFENFNLEFSLTPAPLVIMSTEMNVTLNAKTVVFDLSSKFQPTQIQFDGKMKGEVRKDSLNYN